MQWWRWASLFLMAVATISCKDPVASGDPGFGHSPFENCHEDGGIQVCIEKSTYAPGELVPLTVSNGLPRKVFEDLCAGGIEGRRSPEEEWSGSFGMARGCLLSMGTEDTTGSMRPLPVGALSFDTFSVNPLAYDGEWRAWIRVLEKSGEVLRQTPFVSPVFLVRNSK